MSLQSIQVNIVGFGGKPATVLGLYDSEKDSLVVAKGIDIRRDRVKDAVVITNDAASQVREALFRPDDFQAAINAYIAMRDGMGRDGVTPRFLMQSAAERFNPRGGIDVDGYTETGPRYRVNPDTSNGQVGVLAMCWYASKASGMNAALGFAQELAQLNATGWLTID